MYVLLDKEDNSVEVYKYATPLLSAVYGVSDRTMQRIVQNNLPYETEKYILYEARTVNLGNRGGKRYPKDQY